MLMEDTIRINHYTLALALALVYIWITLIYWSSTVCWAENCKQGIFSHNIFYVPLMFLQFSLL